MVTNLHQPRGPGEAAQRHRDLAAEDEYSTVQYSAVQYSTVQYSTVQELSCWAGVRMLHVFSAHHSAHV